MFKWDEIKLYYNNGKEGFPLTLAEDYGRKNSLVDTKSNVND